MIGLTLQDTYHGGDGERLILPAGLWVWLNRVNNPSDVDEVEYWATPLSGYPWPGDMVADWEHVDVRLVLPDDVVAVYTVSE